MTDWNAEVVANTCLSDSFTIRAVSQDDFEDVQVPDKPTQAPSAGASTITSGPSVK
jgi:hypothetical protein